jgi:hypothetical protein
MVRGRAGGKKERNKGRKKGCEEGRRKEKE